MVAVAQHHVLRVAHAPLFERLVVPAARDRSVVAALGPLALAADPLVERFVHRQEPHAVAQVVEFGRHGLW